MEHLLKKAIESGKRAAQNRQECIAMMDDDGMRLMKSAQELSPAAVAAVVRHFHTGFKWAEVEL